MKKPSGKAPTLNPQRLQERADSLQTGGKFNRLKDGKNVLRIFAFPHKVTQDDYKRGIYKKGSPYAPKVGETVSEIDRRRVSHFIDDGNQPCTGTGCEHCAAAAKIRDPKARRQASARQQFEVNAIDPNDLDAGVQIWTLPTSAYRDILAFVNSGEYDIDALFGANGRDFIIKRDKNKPPANMYEVMLRDEAKCQKLDADLQNQVIDLIQESSDMAGDVDEDEDEKDEDEKNTDGDDEAEGDDTDDTDDEDEKPAKKGGKKQADEDETEEDDDEDEKPAKKTDKKPAKAEKKPTKKDDKKSAKPTPKVGSKVKFTGEDGSKVKGTISEVEGDIFKVKDASGGEWEMSAEDFTLL